MSVPAQEQLRKHDHFMMLSLAHLAQCKIFMTFDLLADYLQFFQLLRTSDFHCLVLHGPFFFSIILPHTMNYKQNKNDNK